MVQYNRYVNEFVTWLILKNIGSNELKFNLGSEKGHKYPGLSNINMIQLVNSCPHLRLLEVNGEYVKTEIYRHCFYVPLIVTLNLKS